MKRKNVAMVLGAGGLMAAAFVAGSLMVKHDAARPVVIAGGLTPTATATATTMAPEVTLTPGVSVTAVPETGPMTTTGGSGSQAGNGSGSGNSAQGGSGQQGEAQQLLPQPEQPLPQPQPENPGPVLEENPEAVPPAAPEPEDCLCEPAAPQLVVKPSVVSVTPADNATGVAQSANIVVTFSKAMDKASAEAAFSMQPAVAGAFSWDGAGKVMTFNPAANFAYNATPSWKVGKTASDAMGSSMANDVSGDFSVLKTTKVYLKSQASFDGTVYAPPVNVMGSKAISAGTTLDAGSWQRGFLSFDLSSLPVDLVKIESAQLSVYQDEHTAGAYTETGALFLQSVSYGTLDLSDWGKAMNQFCLGGCANLQQVLSNSAANGWKSADVLGMVSLDWANREERGMRSQFRLAFANENNGSGPKITATFVSGAGLAKVPVIELVYVHK
jgi:hypothetical protein